MKFVTPNTYYHLKRRFVRVVRSTNSRKRKQAQRNCVARVATSRFGGRWLRSCLTTTYGLCLLPMSYVWVIKLQEATYHFDPLDDGAHQLLGLQLFRLDLPRERAGAIRQERVTFLQVRQSLSLSLPYEREEEVDNVVDYRAEEHADWLEYFARHCCLVVVRRSWAWKERLVFESDLHVKDFVGI